MTLEDVCNTLIQQNMIFVREPTPPPIRPFPGQSIKFPRGRRNGIVRRQLQRLQTQDKEMPDGHNNANGEFVPPKHYEIHFDRVKVDEYLKKWESKGHVKLRAEKLQWTPYLTTRIPQEANLRVVPAMDIVIEGNSKANSTQSTTPAPVKDGSSESHASEDFGLGNNELPSVIADLDQALTPQRKKTPTKNWDADLFPSEFRRGTTPPPASTPLTPSRSLRTRSSNTSILTSPEETVTLHVTTQVTVTKKLSSGKLEMINNDEAFAAKLAMEEQLQQGRQLRSRRSESQLENKLPVTFVPPPLKSVSSRKRRRIDCSPELVEMPNPSEPGHEDGNDGEMDVDVLLPMNGNRVNGHHHLERHTLTQVSVAGDVVNVTEKPEVKSEDTATPLMGSTSGRCVSSDDTIYTTDEAGKLMHYHESDLRSTLVGREGIGGIDMDDCHDEDADGEYEEDAEGEPDSEVEGLTAY